MASAAEQLAANVSFKAFANAHELQKRLLFTLAALIIFRLGSYIPLPGIDPTIMSELASRNSQGLFGMFDILSGGALSRMSIFALQLMPYITASIIIQLMTTVSPTLEALKKEGEAGRKKLNQYTRYGTVLLGTIQSYTLALGLEYAQGSTGASPVLIPGIIFKISTVVSIVSGTLFLVWLGEQITSRGIGQGTSLIIFAGIVAGLPGAVVHTLELGRTGAISIVFILGLLILVLATVLFIIFMEKAQRKIPIQYPKRQMGGKMFGGESSHLPLKINTAGVIPPIFAGALLSFPATLTGFSQGAAAGLLGSVTHYLSHGQPLYMALYLGLIIFFSFVYTAIVFNPDETAENLRKNGGFILGIRPGKSTAEYLDYVLTRITVLGAVYIAAVCLMPEILISQSSAPFYFGGTSVLIVVSVTMDTVAQIHSHLLAHQYEGLLKKTKLKGRS
jgi:preprotein translocase subunit SecY